MPHGAGSKRRMIKEKDVVVITERIVQKSSVMGFEATEPFSVMKMIK